MIALFTHAPSFASNAVVPHQQSSFVRIELIHKFRGILFTHAPFLACIGD